MQNAVKETIDVNQLPQSLEVHHIQAILQCGRKQAYELVNSGAFHVVKVGSKFRISKRIFLQWFEGQETG